MRPNFLWISLEDTSPRLGCYGDPVARTPHMDRLAAEGTRFPNTFCTSPVCSPSRTTVITGVSATLMGAQHMRTTFQAEEFPELPTPYHAVPPPHVKCLPEYLRAAGYWCTNNGKSDYQFENPFTAWDENGKPATVDEIHWRNRPDPAQPFFAVFNLEDSHESRMWAGMAPRLEGDARPHLRTDPAAVSVPPFLPDTSEVRAAIARQYDNLAHNDAIVGKLLAQLEEDGLAENTVVMLWADHGDGLPRAKRFLYDSGLRVPLIVRWPARNAGGGTDERLVSLIDLAPTVLEATGLPRRPHFEGYSLLQPSRRLHAFAQRDRLDGDYDKARAVRSARFKYIRNDYPGLERFGYMPYAARHEAMRAIRLAQLAGDDSFDRLCEAEELYDLANDPFEMHNLIADPALAEVCNELQRALERWETKYDPDRNLGEDQLAQRLWPGGRRPVTAAPIAAIYSIRHPEGMLVPVAAEAAGPALLQLACASEGASIGYRFGDEGSWMLYRSVIHLNPGTHSLVLKAVRYGYATSEERRIILSIL